MVETFAPTPTQAENDLAAVGQTVVEKEPDGSEEQPPIVPAPEFKMPTTVTREMEAKKPTGSYTTRAATSKPATPAPAPASAPASKPE